ISIRGAIQQCSFGAGRSQGGQIDRSSIAEELLQPGSVRCIEQKQRLIGTATLWLQGKAPLTIPGAPSIKDLLGLPCNTQPLLATDTPRYAARLRATRLACQLGDTAKMAIAHTESEQDRHTAIAGLSGIRGQPQRAGAGEAQYLHHGITIPLA